MITAADKPLSEDAIRRALDEFSIIVNDLQVVLIQQYMAILQRWNEKLNLTAIRDPLEILYRHFCESMYAAVAVPIESGRLADIGSGAGFPGIPMKILRPDVELFLVESNIKKGTFLAEVVRELELSGTRVLIGRYEELFEELAPLDYVCSRALGEWPFLGVGSVRSPDGSPCPTLDWRPRPPRNTQVAELGVARSDPGAKISSAIPACGNKNDENVGVTTK